MHRSPGGRSGSRSSHDPHGPPPGGREDGRTHVQAPPLSPTASLTLLSNSHGRGLAGVGVCTVSSIYRDGPHTSGGSSSQILSRMVTHATRATIPWARGRQTHRLLAPPPPPRLEPLTDTPAVPGQAAVPPRPRHEALRIHDHHQHHLPPPHGHSTVTATTSTTTTSATTSSTTAMMTMSSSSSAWPTRTALPLLPLSAVATGSPWVPPEPVWRRSKPLTRLPATTHASVHRQSPSVSAATVEALGHGGCDAGLQASPISPAPAMAAVDGVGPVFLLCADDGADVASPECVVSALSPDTPMQGSQLALPDVPTASIGCPQEACTTPQQGAKETAVEEQGAALLVVAAKCDDGGVDVSALPPTSQPHEQQQQQQPSQTSSAHHRSTGISRSLSGVGGEGAVDTWAHEAAVQPTYAHTHQLPLVFAELVRDLLVAQPCAEADAGEAPLDRWMRTWFTERRAAQVAEEQRRRHLQCRHAEKGWRLLDEAAVASTATAAAHCCGDVVGAAHACLHEAAVTRLRPAANPSAAAPPRLVAPSLGKPSSASLMQLPTVASPPHAYVPLTVDYVRSARQSRTTSGTSQSTVTPPKPTQTQPPSAATIALLSPTEHGSTPHPPAHASGGAHSSTLSSAPPPPQQQQQQQQSSQTQTSTRPTSGGARLAGTTSLARSLSSKQTILAAVAFAGGGGGGGGGGSGGGARTKVATTAYAALAYSHSSSVTKEAARPHE